MTGSSPGAKKGLADDGKRAVGLPTSADVAANLFLRERSEPGEGVWGRGAGQIEARLAPKMPQQSPNRGLADFDGNRSVGLPTGAGRCS